LLLAEIAQLLEATARQANATTEEKLVVVEEEATMLL
jgi:hypothetical protein